MSIRDDSNPTNQKDFSIVSPGMVQSVNSKIEDKKDNVTV